MDFEYSQYGRTSRHGSTDSFKELVLKSSLCHVRIVWIVEIAFYTFNFQSKQCGHTFRLKEAWTLLKHMYHILQYAVCQMFSYFISNLLLTVSVIL